MFPVTVRRQPLLYCWVLAVVAVLHVGLSYSAATSRGYPPPDPFWEFIAIYLAFLGVALAPTFDDLENQPRLRRSILAGLAVFMSCVLAVVFANKYSSIPRIGSLTGFWGVIYYCRIEVIIFTILYSLVAVPFVICFESVSRGFWACVRQFRSAGQPGIIGDDSAADDTT